MVDIITCSRPPFCCYGNERGMQTGARSDHKQQLSCCKPIFIDFNYHKPNWDLHLGVIKELMPKYASAPDILDNNDIGEILEKAEELQKYSENVIVIPHKTGAIDKIPKEFVIGYSIPTEYGGAEYPIMELMDRRVHLLGGSPRKQFELYQYIPNVISLDCNSFIRASQFGSYVGKDLRWNNSEKNKGKDMEWLITKSIDNIMEFWKKVNGGKK